MQIGHRIALSFLVIFSTIITISSDAFASGSMAGHDKRFAVLISKYANANGVPLELARAVVKHESGYNSRATGKAGEIGLMQIKLSTARGMGYRGSPDGLYDPATNLHWGMKYLGQARKLAAGSECATLSKYNGGHGTKRMIHGYCGKVRLAKGG